MGEELGFWKYLAFWGQEFIREDNSKMNVIQNTNHLMQKCTELMADQELIPLPRRRWTDRLLPCGRCDSLRPQSQKSDYLNILEKPRRSSPLSPTRPRIFISQAGKVNTETNPGEIRELCHSIARWMVSLRRVAVRNAARAWQSASAVGALKLKARGTSKGYTPAPSPCKWEKWGLRS